ncbi:MAG: MarR family transcriptional regulator [Alphaproteobacteria bacterium]|nr:MarR family transcriptional regulator [Alphaproteobacteria bacterium]
MNIFIKIRRYMRVHDTATVAELAAHCLRSRDTASNAVRRMVKGGELKLVGKDGTQCIYSADKLKPDETRIVIFNKPSVSKPKETKVTANLMPGARYVAERHPQRTDTHATRLNRPSASDFSL